MTRKNKRSRKMTEKGLEYTISVKEQAANSAINQLNQLYNKFHETLRSSQNVLFIKSELDALSKLSNETATKLIDCSTLISDSDILNHVEQLQNMVQTSLQSAQRIALINEDNASFISKSVSRQSRVSTSSLKDTLLKARARRAALEEQLKLSDAILEQEKALAKLKIQQEINSVRAEEDVYRDADIDELDDQPSSSILSPPQVLFSLDENPRWMSRERHLTTQ